MTAGGASTLRGGGATGPKASMGVFSSAIALIAIVVFGDWRGDASALAGRAGVDPLPTSAAGVTAPSAPGRAEGEGGAALALELAELAAESAPGGTAERCAALDIASLDARSGSSADGATTARATGCAPLPEP